jgi:hypothetical protein
MPRSRIAPALAVGALCAGLALAAPPATAAPAAADRQQQYAAAAHEFGVPESVLLAVSYLESRWDTNGGAPSFSGGYGPMHLTDTASLTGAGDGAGDPRGDDARPLSVTTPTAQAATPADQTLDRAAALTGTSPAALRGNVAQNLRGGAALLAQYQRDLGVTSANPADWYGAVARYAGAADRASAAQFADEVFDQLRTGADRVTDDGQHVRLPADPGVRPATGQLDRLGLRTADTTGVECPPGLACESVPAPYQDLGGGNYGNHDLADRPNDQSVDYIVIHDTEASWDETLKLVQDPNYVSWHYTVRSADGQVAQHVPTKDVAWHAGNWYVNAHAIGIEHEGYGANGAWYTEAMYRSSAKLVRYLAARYRIPLDRQHIIGHDNVPGTTPASIPGMHWDPGPYWDWTHYFDLLGAPITAGWPGRGLVTVTPDYQANQPAFTGCATAGQPCPPHASSSLILHTAPSDSAPLLKDAGLHPDGSPATMDVADVGSRVDAGQRYAVADRQGDWTAIWYLGQVGWFHDPADAPTTHPTGGLVAVARPGAASVPVYGRAYPEASAYPAGVPVQSVIPLPYTVNSGERYAVGGVVGSEYYWSNTFDTASHQVVRGQTRYVEIQFGHRVGYVKLSDVLLLPAG